MKRVYGCEKGSYDDGWQVCYYYVQMVVLLYVLLLGGVLGGVEIPLSGKLSKADRRECCCSV